MSDTPQLRHFYLVSGKAIFSRAKSNDVEALDINTTIVTDVPRITAKDIGKAQQGIQMLLFKRIGVQINVMDVFISSISSLGHMTEEQFVAGVEELQTEAANVH